MGGDVGGVGVNSSDVGFLLGSKDGSCSSSGAIHPHRFIHIDMEQRMYLFGGVVVGIFDQMLQRHVHQVLSAFSGFDSSYDTVKKYLKSKTC